MRSFDTFNAFDSHKGMMKEMNVVRRIVLEGSSLFTRCNQLIDVLSECIALTRSYIPGSIRMQPCSFNSWFLYSVFIDLPLDGVLEMLNIDNLSCINLLDQQTHFL